MRTAGIPRKAMAALIVSAGLLDAPKLFAEWGFAENWDIVKKWAELPSDWGLSLFEMAGGYGAYALGTDDDCNGTVDRVIFIGEKEMAGMLRLALPTEELCLFGGVLTTKGWNGVTIIDPATYGDLVLLTYGEPPAGMSITAPIVIDISEPMIADKSSPMLLKAMGFFLAASQACATRIEWDTDGDGLVDKVDYWGQHAPVFLGPIFPPLKRDLLIAATDDNDPPKTATFYVGGNLSSGDPLLSGGIVIPNSNMGFKLNLVSVEIPGAGLFSNMGFKLNYTLWQGGDNDPDSKWWGHCNAWATSSWALIPEEGPTAIKKIVGICLGTACAAFDGPKNGCETGFTGGESLPLEEVSFNFWGNGKAALFYALNGWESQGMGLSAQSARIGGEGPAAAILLEGESWTVKAEIKLDYDKIFMSGGIGTVHAVNLGLGHDTPWAWNYRTNTWEDLAMDAEAEESLFIRGEVNLDSYVRPDISDAIFIIQWLFLGGAVPLCRDTADVNDDGLTDISDSVALLAYLFQGGKAPGEPFPGAGADPTPDGLGCDLMK